jgi:two-component system, response regulator
MSTPKLLLCVEDDEDDCAWIEEASAELDPRLVFVAKPNGKEALMFLHRQKEQNFLPCLILLDLNMPGMDGKQTLQEIKKVPDFKKIPVVVFTTSSSKKDQLFCEQYGAEMITKPDQAKELKKTIQHIVLSRCMNPDLKD